ncbi:hypothetical protein niasHS_004304 [Heterodera schachtii]|uniref:Protein kinase domain-containing protein n=1 Tax=Heterodera schachtii TaxID=97005 RepID=A0ABD2JUV4_HETSC
MCCSNWADALRLMHIKKTMHRDLNASNVLIREISRGQNDDVKRMHVFVTSARWSEIESEEEKKAHEKKEVGRLDRWAMRTAGEMLDAHWQGVLELCELLVEKNTIRPKDLRRVLNKSLWEINHPEDDDYQYEKADEQPGDEDDEGEEAEEEEGEEADGGGAAGGNGEGGGNGGGGAAGSAEGEGEEEEEDEDEEEEEEEAENGQQIDYVFKKKTF